MRRASIMAFLIFLVLQARHPLKHTSRFFCDADSYVHDFFQKYSKNQRFLQDFIH